MRNKKLASLLSIALLSLMAPFLSIPNVQAFHSPPVTVEVTGTVVEDFDDPLLGTVTAAAKESSPVNLYVRVVASSVTGQRNLTVGVKFDWMTTWQNASTATPTSTLSLQANQIAIVPIAVTMPALSANPGLNFARHTWEVRVWNSAKDSSVSGGVGDCTSHSGSNVPGCASSGTFSGFAIYSNDQADGVKARQEADSKRLSLTSTLSSLTELPPGAGRAAADLSAASAELTLGDNSYENGDFAGAKTHYTNALNLANSAAGSLQGGDSADFTNLLLNGTGWLLGGVGVFIAGFGSFWYLRKKPKA